MPAHATCQPPEKSVKTPAAHNLPAGRHGEARKITDKIIHYFLPAGRHGKHNQVEVIMDNSSSALTRYADNIITQNVSEH
ncbi:MAG TPA: hypothetical protein VJC37_02130, partial [Planctomycetota bacterium]|nr:hypothetical protein [Planctomycetota bacterium]